MLRHSPWGKQKSPSRHSFISAQGPGRPDGARYPVEQLQWKEPWVFVHWPWRPQGVPELHSSTSVHLPR